MKTTIEKIEADLKNNYDWIITVICPSPGAIIVINNAFTTPIFTYRKDDNGVYVADKVLPYTAEARTPLCAMIAAHNANPDLQIDAEQFDLYK